MPVVFDPCEITGDQSETDAIVGRYSEQMRRLSEALISGDSTLDVWHEKMQDLIRLAYIHQAAAADDGNLVPEDRTRIEAAIRGQYDFLDKFVDDIEAAMNGGKSLDFVPSRAVLYAESSAAEYWRQAIKVDLPAIPRDGSTECMGNCQCHWRLECREPGIVRATWVLGEADHCPDCVERAGTWNPILIPTRKGGEQS